ncbi:MAG: exodeoxyribonuclease VII small subunit [Gammaproteobacteria bacterium]|nr:exodeoxyribonuclease VII small subunit [Gammaproteobacteria bacterium]
MPKSTRFEDALGELESIVKSLESGDPSLEQSLEQFERGVSLARFCQQSLKEAEQKVQILMDDKDVETLEAFDESSE